MCSAFSRRADLDKLAKVVQIFPTRSRRSLQRALANTEGNIMAAVDFLLSERGRRGVEPNDGARAAAGSGLITSEAARPSQASDRPPGTSRSTGEELICGLVSLPLERDGAAFGGSTSGGPANDSARDPDAVGLRPESRPSSASAAAGLFRLSFGRTRPRDAEAVSGATSSQAPQLAAVTATGGATGGIVGGGNRSAEGIRSMAVMVDEEMGTSFSQQVGMAIARALQQRSSPEPSSDAAELHQRLGDTAASPCPPGRLEANV